mmetsp:Transcript_17384/g.26154  ORF Transcript_17384/g.26154 Transcript_17384/m.26154 type:complete len:84 (+) Transcript_17384:1579-1830(+)
MPITHTNRRSATPKRDDANKTETATNPDEKSVVLSVLISSTCIYFQHLTKTRIIVWNLFETAAVPFFTRRLRRPSTVSGRIFF